MTMKIVKRYKWIIIAAVAALLAVLLAFVNCTHIRKMLFPMTTEEFVPCDLDGDKDCDENDYEIATNAIGQCIDGDYYIRPADADRDGCVTEDDLRMLFPDSLGNSVAPLIQE